jgi:CRP/FNR family cyclic AMP-dependent transcriptional regulator
MSGALWSLPESHLKVLSEQGVVRSFPKNAVIINVGDRADTMYIILSGRVKVYLSDEAGKEILLRTMGPGEYFGELVLDGQTRAASVMTLEPSRFFVIPQRDADALLTGNPQFARHLVRKLIGKVRSLTEQVRNLALRDVYSRLVRFLEEQAGGGWPQGGSRTPDAGGDRRTHRRVARDGQPHPQRPFGGRLHRRRIQAGRAAPQAPRARVGMCIRHRKAVPQGVEPTRERE